jgi:hypothetical protein
MGAVWQICHNDTLEGMAMQPLSIGRRLIYAALRDTEARRAHAAKLANISVSSARQIDAVEHRCGLCGRRKGQSDDQ